MPTPKDRFKRFHSALRDEISARDVDDTATFELAVSATRFSRRAKAIVDDKLQFSAVLMRAGEVEAANRLLAEVEQDVRDEEAALLERVSEVAVSHVVQSDRVTRARLARVLVTAMLGASLMAFSAVGMAVAGMFQDDEPSSRSAAAASAEARRERQRAKRDRACKAIHRIRVAGVPVDLTTSELAEYKRLTRGSDLDGISLELFLLDVLPPQIAEKVSRVIVAAAKHGDKVADAELPAPVLEKARRKARKAAQDQKPKDETSPSPSPSQQPSPSPSANPTNPSGSSDDDNDNDESDGPGDDLPIP